jgi:lipopolysaccharide/colanic/teichoic acid biosynthesis glycosyltransferase
VGRDGREFEMLKFRSMRLAPPEEQTLPGNVTQLPTDVGPGGVEGDDRRTAVGTLLRRTSLDELPQLLNVVRGDMSLVGPRPEQVAFLDRYSGRDRRRFEVKPGLTGWWQVNGRKQPMYEHAAEDVYYVDHQSLRLDLVILFRTVFAVLNGRGAV